MLAFLSACGDDDKGVSSSLDESLSSVEQLPASSSEELQLPSSSEDLQMSSSSVIPEESSSSVKQDVSSSSSEKAVWKYLNPAISYGGMVDARDGQVYKTVKIGTQTWMAENLNYMDEKVAVRYAEDRICSDGKVIKCGYGYDCKITNQIQGICPDGWHLPDTTEWIILRNYALENGEGDSVSTSLKSVDGWEPYEGVSQGKIGLVLQPFLLDITVQKKILMEMLFIIA